MSRTDFDVHLRLVRRIRSIRLEVSQVLACCDGLACGPLSRSLGELEAARELLESRMASRSHRKDGGR